MSRDDRKSTKGKTPLRGTLTKLGVGNGGFDRWLDRKLHEHHDSVIAERLPHQLTRMTERLSSRDEHASAASGSGGNDDSD